jgi:hypothetical protein
MTERMSTSRSLDTCSWQGRDFVSTRLKMPSDAPCAHCTLGGFSSKVSHRGHDRSVQCGLVPTNVGSLPQHDGYVST